MELKLRVSSLQHEISTLKAESSRIDAELQARLLQEKDSIISGMSEQLTRAREYLSSNQQVSCLHLTRLYSILENFELA